jgi:alpha-L-fucosidase
MTDSMNRFRRFTLWASSIVLLLTGGIAAAPAAPASEPAAQPTSADPRGDERMAWWRDARFGMFVHWGLYEG